MKRNEINSKDLLLCFLYSPGQKDEANEPIVGRTKLTKMMFLFEKEIYAQFFKDDIQIKLPDFEAYFFGPFSKQLFEDLAFFQSIGMICATETSIPLSPADKAEEDEAFDLNEDDEWIDASFADRERFESAYSLSAGGIKYVEEQVWELFSPPQKKKLQAFKAQINRISLDALLKYVYNKYPETTTESKIANKYLDKAEDRDA